MKIYLVRHPRPLLEPGICYGASDVVCSDTVIEEGARSLLAELPKGLSIVSSPLSRCERLTQTLCALEPDFSYKTDAKLAEMNFGAWEMQRWDAIDRQELSAWTDAFATYRCGGSGESTAIFIQRVAQRLYETARAGVDQIWITHAGVIRALEWLCAQPFELLTALASRPDPARLLGALRAADWPTGEVACCQVRRWDWPALWPLLLAPPVLGSCQPRD